MIFWKFTILFFLQLLQKFLACPGMGRIAGHYHTRVRVDSQRCLEACNAERRPPRLIILDRAYFRRILNRILYRTISTLRSVIRCFTCSLTDRIVTLLVRKPTSLLSKILTFSFGPVHCFVYTFCRRPSPGSYSTVQRQYSCRLPFLRHVRASAGPGQSAAPAAAVCHNAADHPQPQPFVLGAGSRLHKARRARFVQQLQAVSPVCRDSPSFARDFA